MLEKNIKTIYLAGGCFWGTEKYLSLISGVLETEVGYANGKTKDPSYEDVCTKETGHAETVKVIFDSDKISLAEILTLFYETIDPTAKNRQGNDIGAQYRSGVYYVDDDDKKIIQESINKLSNSYTESIQVEVLPLINYYKAEDYHQKYLDKNPYGYCHIGKDAFEKAESFTPQTKYFI
jgi:methionine-S-sulfoxide reductase